MRHQIEMGFSAGLAGKLVVDLFAGGGGASTGIEAALRRPVDHAVNHDPAAIAMHTANHPQTRHYCEDVWAVSPREVCGSQPVGLLWASPDCTQYSKAKNGKPRDRKIRCLANVIVDWAREVRPERIQLENVEEFEDWGPLDDAGYPIKARAGEDFRAFVGALSDLGYKVEWRVLVAADYGAPTTRKRLFALARCDGQPIVWPAPTHGKWRRKPWRTAAEIIDWSLRGRSIFGRPKPLAWATERRIAVGLKRYVFEATQPFIVPAHPGYAALGATLIQTGYGERPGQAPRVPGLDKPLGTVMAGGQKHALIAAWMTKNYGGPNGHLVVGHPLSVPTSTVTTKDHHALSTAFITKYYGTSTGSSCNEPLPTVAARGQHLAQVRAFLIKWYGTSTAASLRDPLHTITTKDRFGLVEVPLLQVGDDFYQLHDVTQRMLSSRELFNAQGFPSSYIIDFDYNGKPFTKTEQVDKAGNSVCPPLSEALTRANALRTLRGGSVRGLSLDSFLTIPLAWRPPLMVADGMGVDSTAMLIELHRRGIRPDAILHADTGDEWPETVAYRDVRRAWLASVRFPDLVVVRRAPSRQGNRRRRDGRTGVTYTTLGENCIENGTLPGLAFGFKSCSIKWKIEPQNRWTDTWEPALRAWGHGQRVVKLIGYDSGPKDSRRAHELDNDAQYNYLYPLREWGWTRNTCVAEIQSAGHIVPRKSACFYCPASKPWEIAQLVRDHPDQANYIIRMEAAARPYLRNSDGLWRKTTKGARGAVARPGSMSEFIRSLRSDPALLRRHLQMAPSEDATHRTACEAA